MSSPHICQIVNHPHCSRNILLFDISQINEFNLQNSLFVSLNNFMHKNFSTYLKSSWNIEGSNQSRNNVKNNRKTSIISLQILSQTIQEYILVI